MKAVVVHYKEFDDYKNRTNNYEDIKKCGSVHEVVVFLEALPSYEYVLVGDVGKNRLGGTVESMLVLMRESEQNPNFSWQHNHEGENNERN